MEKIDYEELLPRDTWANPQTKFECLRCETITPSWNYNTKTNDFNPPDRCQNPGCRNDSEEDWKELENKITDDIFYQGNKQTGKLFPEECLKLNIERLAEQKVPEEVARVSIQVWIKEKKFKFLINEIDLLFENYSYLKTKRLIF